MHRLGMVGLSSTIALAGLLVGTALGASPSAYSGPATLSAAGSIRGVVLCGEGETATAPVPREWSTVWVQGRSLSARTDQDGTFRIDYVPAGTYVLGVQTAGMPIRGEFTVTVRARTVTDAGQLVVHGGCGACGGGGGGEAGSGEEGGCTDGSCGGEA
ncbi:MAG: hypothetical protein ACM3OO_03055 [Planctomycetaceae bacterium]